MVWVPPEIRKALLELEKLEDGRFRAFIDAVSRRPISMYPNEKAWWPRNVDGISEETLGEVLDAALFLRWTASESEDDRTADVTMTNIVAETAKHGKLDEEARVRLRERMNKLVGVPSLIKSSRAFVLSMSNPNCLVKSRVITDVRPVFLDPSSVELAGAVILHRLQMSLVREDADLYVTIDGRDLQKLIDQLQRAQLKGVALTETLSRADVCTFPPNAMEESR